MTTHRTYVALHVFLAVLASTFMVARFAAKYITVHRVNLTSDDALLAAALVSAVQIKGRYLNIPHQDFPHITHNPTRLTLSS